MSLISNLRMMLSSWVNCLLLMSRILTCFHLASGLKVNFNKSKIFGIGVNVNELNSLASSLGCQPSQFPCTYLGLPIGANMSRSVSWLPLVDRFQKRFSNWKSNSLSFGGRLTLINAVLRSLRVYFFSTFKAPKLIINQLEGPVWGCDRLVSRANVIENQVMTALVISISPNVSVESVGSSFPRVILIGSISVKVPVSPEVGADAVASPDGVLELETYSSLEANPSESSPPPVFVTPMVSPFLCSDDSESDTEMPERHVSPTPHDAMLTRWRNRVASRSSSPTTSTPEIPTAPILFAPSAIVAPSSEFPLAPIVAPPGIRRR
ncbi:hypothetical protein Tco_0971095 [Tanacetum coccineum]